MTICDNLVPFADGEISPDDAAAFRVHLKDCEECQERLVEANQLSARLSHVSGDRDDPRYHLRVASEARLVAPNVLWFKWCGYVYAEPNGTYDLSIFLRNCAISGALCASYQSARDSWLARVKYVHEELELAREALQQTRSVLSAVESETTPDAATRVIARVKELEAEVAEIRPVVEAAERYRDRPGRDTSHLDVLATVDSYRAARGKAEQCSRCGRPISPTCCSVPPKRRTS